MYITGYHLTYCGDLGEFRINSFFKGMQKIILKHFSLRREIIRDMLMPNGDFD